MCAGGGAGGAGARRTLCTLQPCAFIPFVRYTPGSIQLLFLRERNYARAQGSALSSDLICTNVGTYAFRRKQSAAWHLAVPLVARWAPNLAAAASLACHVLPAALRCLSQRGRLASTNVGTNFGTVLSTSTTLRWIERCRERWIWFWMSPLRVHVPRVELQLVEFMIPGCSLGERSLPPPSPRPTAGARAAFPSTLLGRRLSAALRCHVARRD